MLRDGYERAREILPNFKNVIHADAVEHMLQLSENPHVIYLDPMFPKEGKQRATKLGMSFLRDLIDVETESCELAHMLDVARKVALRKVIVKRPKYAPIDKDVAHSFVARDTRFDMFMPLNPS
jgi:16S rRNA (guanine1516-N2)-methyltransferase